MAKLADYAAVVAGALRQRGVPEPTASLAAETGMTVLRVAVERWSTRDDESDLAVVMQESLAELRALATGS